MIEAKLKFSSFSDNFRQEKNIVKNVVVKRIGDETTTPNLERNEFNFAVSRGYSILKFVKELDKFKSFVVVKMIVGRNPAM